VAGIFFVSDFRGNRMAASLESISMDLPELREAVLFADWEEFCASGSPTERFPVVTPDDIAQIQYTSGTTGFPKGAMLHHRGITNNARFSLKRRDAATASVSANPMPLFHTASSCLMAVGLPQFDCCHVLFPYFDPGLVLQVCESEGATSLAGVPTMLIALMEHPDFSGRDLSRLHGVVSGGSTVPTELVRRIEATLGVTFTIQFGMTETSPTITQTWPHDSPEDKAETIGQPLPNAEVKIVHPDTFETVPAGVAGELWVRGYQVMKGYFDMLDETAQAIVDGWMRTGDLCSMDERGYCRVEGRLKDMIIRGGENIYPREIEELLFRHPKVAEAAVVGIPDARWGEQVVAFIRPAAGQSVREQDLFAYCRENLSPQKTPQQWVFVDELPTTPTGKVQKFVLRDRLLAKT
jgi:fatty-acyl-CoA synthase